MSPLWYSSCLDMYLYLTTMLIYRSSKEPDRTIYWSSTKRRNQHRPRYYRMSWQPGKWAIIDLWHGLSNWLSNCSLWVLQILTTGSKTQWKCGVCYLFSNLPEINVGMWGEGGHPQWPTDEVGTWSTPWSSWNMCWQSSVNYLLFLLPLSLSSSS